MCVLLFSFCFVAGFLLCFVQYALLHCFESKAFSTLMEEHRETARMGLWFIPIVQRQQVQHGTFPPPLEESGTNYILFFWASLFVATKAKSILEALISQWICRWSVFLFKNTGILHSNCAVPSFYLLEKDLLECKKISPLSFFAEWNCLSLDVAGVLLKGMLCVRPKCI